MPVAGHRFDLNLKNSKAGLKKKIILVIKHRLLHTNATYTRYRVLNRQIVSTRSQRKTNVR